MASGSSAWPETEAAPLLTRNTLGDQTECALVSARRLIEETLANHRERQARGHVLFETHDSEESLLPFVARFLQRAPGRRVVVQASSGLWLRNGREVPALQRFQEGLLAAGGELRLLTEPDAASEPDVAARLSRFVEAGVELRVGSTYMPGVLVLDRVAVVLRVPDPERPGVGTLALVRLPEVVSVMNELMRSLWSGAVELRLFQQRAELQDGLTGRILRLLQMGYKDEAAARSLGLSVRTYRRHVAVVMNRLNADSRFQAGVQAASLGL